MRRGKISTTILFSAAYTTFTSLVTFNKNKIMAKTWQKLLVYSLGSPIFLFHETFFLYSDACDMHFFV